MINKIRKTAISPTLSKELNETEKLIEYLVKGKESVTLTDSEKTTLERYFFVYDQLNQKKSRHEVVNHLIGLFHISKAQAYRDVFNAQFVISSSISIDEKFYESFLLDAIVETIRLAAKKGDLRAKAQAERNLAMVLGYPKDEDNRIRPEILQQNILIITTDPTALGLTSMPNKDEMIERWKKRLKKKKSMQLEHDDER
ncbi:MAG: hypothetical protein PF450_07190 [Bacteroidales bacterium]|jgi:hypothetical protein|nr:hypothetical protein [Bacteroidales bacterium]